MTNLKQIGDLRAGCHRLVSQLLMYFHPVQQAFTPSTSNRFLPSAYLPDPPLSSSLQVMEATRELVTEANLEVSPEGISLQAMDSSHVSLVAFTLRSDGFEHFRADRTFSMGLNLNNMSKMLRCLGRDDSVSIRCDESTDAVFFTFETPGALSRQRGGA